jgi:hypothetical protein
MTHRIEMSQEENSSFIKLFPKYFGKEGVPLERTLQALGPECC